MSRAPAEERINAMTPRLSRNRQSVFALAATLAAVSLLAAACGSDEPDVANPVGGQDVTDEGDAGHDEFSFGEPADAADADRVIEIDADDDFSFTPDTIEVEVGETITFRVTNVGNLPHDFTLGDSETQDEHDAEMAEMDDMGMDADDPNAMTVPTGETPELTWTFTEAGEILMGCHVPGHYDAGMRGEITITAAS